MNLDSKEEYVQMTSVKDIYVWVDHLDEEKQIDEEQMSLKGPQHTQEDDAISDEQPDKALEGGCCGIQACNKYRLTNLENQRYASFSKEWIEFDKTNPRHMAQLK